MRFVYIPKQKQELKVKDTEKLKSLLETYSPEEIFLKGKQFAEEEDYLNANIAFRELLKSDDFRMQELARVYIAITEPPLLVSLRDVFPNFNVKEFLGEDEQVMNSLISGMIDAQELYKDGFLPKKELFNLEKLVDRFPFGKIKTKPALERVYSEFKEYVTNIFLKDNASQ